MRAGNMDAGTWLELAFETNQQNERVREDIMRRLLTVLLLLIGPQALAQQAVPEIAFDSVPNPLHLPPNMYFGEVSGVSLNSKGHAFVLSRGNTTGPAFAAAAAQLLTYVAKA